MTIFINQLSKLKTDFAVKTTIVNTIFIEAGRFPFFRCAFSYVFCQHSPITPVHNITATIPLTSLCIARSVVPTSLFLGEIDQPQ
jgi:hypothetical protein